LSKPLILFWAVALTLEVVQLFIVGRSLLLFEQDDQTNAVAAFGEIGGSQEEEVAEVIKSGKFIKPFVIYIAGSATTEGQRRMHQLS
jgi:succinyl-CoA synthetase alpha subunit